MPILGISYRRVLVIFKEGEGVNFGWFGSFANI